MVDVASRASFEDRLREREVPVAEGDSNFKPEHRGCRGGPERMVRANRPLATPRLVLLINYSQVYFALHENLRRSGRVPICFNFGCVDFDLKWMFLFPRPSLAPRRIIKAYKRYTEKKILQNLQFKFFTVFSTALFHKGSY